MGLQTPVSSSLLIKCCLKNSSANTKYNYYAKVIIIESRNKSFTAIIIEINYLLQSFWLYKKDDKFNIDMEAHTFWSTELALL